MTILSIHILEHFFLVPPRAMCSEFSNHERKSIGSPDIETVKFTYTYYIKLVKCFTLF